MSKKAVYKAVGEDSYFVLDKRLNGLSVSKKNGKWKISRAPIAPEILKNASQFTPVGEIDVNDLLMWGILEAAGYRDNPKYPEHHCFTVCRCKKCGEAFEASYEHICRRKNSYPDIPWPDEEE